MNLDEAPAGPTRLILNSLDILSGAELDDHDRFTLAMLKILIASRLPGKDARAQLGKLSPEIDQLIEQASVPTSPGTICASLPQDVVRILVANGTLRPEVDVAEWRPSRRWSRNADVGEREALIAELASDLFAGLVSDGPNPT